MNKQFFRILLLILLVAPSGWGEESTESKVGRIDKMESYEILPGSAVPLSAGDVRLGIISDLTTGFSYNIEAATNVLANILTLLNLDLSWAPILDPKWGAFQMGSSLVYNPSTKSEDVVIKKKNTELFPYVQYSVFLTEKVLQHTSISRSYFRALYGEGLSPLLYDDVLKDSSPDDIHIRTTTEIRLFNKRNEYAGSLALVFHAVPELKGAGESFFLGETSYTFAWKVFHLKLGLSFATRKAAADNYGHFFPVVGMYWTL